MRRVEAKAGFSLGLAGVQTMAGLDWYINGQFSSDRLVRSTDLTHGTFNSRSYMNLSIAPGRQWQLASGSVIYLKAGLRADLSSPAACSLPINVKTA